MREVLAVLFFSIFLINLTYSQTEKFEISFKPELGETYSLNFNSAKTINMHTVDIFLNEGRVLFGDSIKVTLKDFKKNENFTLEFKVENVLNDTITYGAVLKNLNFNFENLPDDNSLSEEIQTQLKFNQLFLNEFKIPFIIKSTSKGEIYYFEALDDLIFENNDFEILTVEEINDLESQFKDKFYSNSFAGAFLIDFPNNKVGIDEEWESSDQFELEMGGEILVKTRYKLKGVADSYYIVKSISNSSYSHRFEIGDTLIESEVIGIENSVYHIDKITGWLIFLSTESNANGTMDYIFEINENQKYGFRTETSESTVLIVKGEIKK